MALNFYSSFAVNKYWYTSVAGNWNDASKWSTSSTSFVSTTAPTSSDVAFFPGGVAGNAACSITAAVSVAGINISGYTGTITQGAFNVTIGASGYTQTSGIFTGNATSPYTMTVNGTYSQSGGTCSSAYSSTFSGSYTLSGGTFNARTTTNFSGAYTLSGTGIFNASTGTINFTSNNLIQKTGGTFNNGSGTVNIRGNRTLDLNGITFNILQFNPDDITSCTILLNSDFNVSTSINYFNGGGSFPVILNGIGKTIHNYGHLTISNTVGGGGGSATIKMETGTGGVTPGIITGSGVANTGSICNLTVSKSVTLSGMITIAGDVTFLTGAALTVSGSTLVMEPKLGGATSSLFLNSAPSGTNFPSFNNLKLSNVPATAYTYNITGSSSSDMLNVMGTLELAGNGAINIGSGTINAKTNIINSANNSTSGGGAGTIIANNISTYSITGHATAGTGPLCHLKINRPSLSTALTINNSITVNGDLTFMAGSTANAINTGTGSGTIYCKGNVYIDAASNLDGGTATLVLNGTGAQTINGNATLAGKLPNLTIAKTTGNLTFTNNIQVKGNYTFQSLTGGTFTTTGSTLNMYANGAAGYNLNTGGAAYPLNNLSINNTTIGIGAVNLASALTLNGNLTVNTNGTLATTSNTTSVSGNITINTGGILSATTGIINASGNWTDNGTFNAGTGTVQFQGAVNPQLLVKSAGNEAFYNLKINKSATTGRVDFSCPVQILSSGTLTFTKGILKSTNTSVLVFMAGSLHTGASDNSFADAAIEKIGNTAFTFPLGSTNTAVSAKPYHPLTITAPAAASDDFIAQYFPANQTQGNGVAESVENLSTCEYWTLKRAVGTANVLAGLGWNTTTCTNVYPYSGELLVAYKNSSVTNWESLGGANSAIVGGTVNTVQSTAAVPFVSATELTYLTLAKQYGNCGVLRKKLDGGYFMSSNKVLRFKYDEEYTDTDALLNFRVLDKTNQVVFSQSNLPAGQASTLAPAYYADNRYSLNFNNMTPLVSMVSGDMYILEVTNEKNEKLYLRFKFN